MKNFCLLMAICVSAMFIAGCSKSKNSETESSNSDMEFEIVNDDYNYTTSGESSASSDYSSSETSSDSDGSDYSSSSSEENWDDVLESYNEFADKYIALLKKAAKGDASALSEYSEYVEEAQDFVSKMSSAKGSMTSSQIAQFNKIQQKIAKAASSFKIDPSKLKSVKNAIESVSSSYGLDNSDDDDDDDW